VFKTNNQTAEVTESDEVGFLVALVQASDRDGDSLWYDILGKNKYAFFMVIQNSNVRHCILYYSHAKDMIVQYNPTFMFKVSNTQKRMYIYLIIKRYLIFARFS